MQCIICSENRKYFGKYLFLLAICLWYNLSPAQNNPGTDILSYSIQMDMTGFRQKNIRAVCDVKFALQDAQVLDKLRLMLLKLKVDSVHLRKGLDVDFKKTAWTYNDTLLTIVADADTESVVRIFYHGTPVTDARWGGFYFKGDYSFNLGVGFASVPHTFGRVWFPCVDNFTDKALFRYKVKVPDGFAAVCGGDLKDTLKNPDGSVVWTWEHRIPISTYLASVAVAPYKLVRQEVTLNRGTTPVILAALARDTQNMKRSFANLNAALQAYEYWYGPYRFERVGYSVVPFDGGAMEHACNIAYPLYAVNGNLTNETLMAHELSHHWWGNNVTCATAPEMWLNEGWASYSEVLFIEQVYGKKAAQAYINKVHKGVLQFAHLIDGGAKAVNNQNSGQTYGKHVYKKGSDMIHTLRHAMDDKVFRERCTSLMEKREFGNITTDEFTGHFNHGSGLPKQFIEQIISDTGFCHFSLYSYSSKPEAGGWKTTIQYRQKNRLGRHVYDSMPFEISLFDQNFSRLSTKVYLGQGQVSVFSPFKPVFLCLDYDQKFSDAITDDALIIDSAGKYTMDMANLSIQVKSVRDSVIFRVEHNWVHPDAYFNNLPGILLSTERYWTVDGIFDSTFVASATFAYDGSKPSNYASGWLDNQLTDNRSEDSLVLLYRRNAESNWTLARNAVRTIGNRLDKKGTFVVDSITKGEYAFGVYGKPKTSGLYEPWNGSNRNSPLIRVFPNPAKDRIRLEWDRSLQAATLEIYNKRGQRIGQMIPDKNRHAQVLDLEGYIPGNYIVILTTSNQLVYTHEFMVAP